MQQGDRVKYSRVYLESGNISPRQQVSAEKKRGTVHEVRKAGSMFIAVVRWRGQTRNTLVNSKLLEVYWRESPSTDLERLGE